MKSKNIWIINILFPIICLLLLSQCDPPASTTGFIVDQDHPQIDFAIHAIQQAMQMSKPETNGNDRQGISQFRFVIEAENGMEPEGFHIRRKNDQVEITAIDTAGLMYGGLEVAEQIELYGLTGVMDTKINPYMSMRGTKFNIPLDVRTPSYTDASDVAQKNIPEMWSMDFWQEYIDQLAQFRYNFISLWSLHPFPSLVKVPEYPDVALNDVQRSTTKWKEYYHLHGTGLDAAEILENPEIIQQMTMDDKIEFWRKVMQYAHNRNIHFYIVTWNIFNNGTEGKYGITNDIENENTRDYFQKSISELFRTYPYLAGIGLTTGENMDGASFNEKEDWAFDTYAMGLLEVAREMPDRKFTFIHRQHFAAAEEISKKFKPLIEQENIDFIFSFKYAQAHVFSATEQPYHESFVNEIGSLKTIWTLRNDDNYYFRWGAPDFVRTFIKNIPYEVSQGLYYGSDQWVWGREFLEKYPLSETRQIEISKHWYHWMLWGRLSFDPDLKNQRFQDILADRYKEVDVSGLFDAWQNASMIYPLTTGFHWGPLDFQWYIEGCRGRPEYAQNATGFHDVNRFINLPPHPKSGFQSIQDYIEQEKVDLKSPYEVSRMLHNKADSALLFTDIISQVKDIELSRTIDDIRCMAYLGKYYAHKIAGATYLALYRQDQLKEHQQSAIDELTGALGFWIKYVDAAKSNYINPIWTNRVGYVDWEGTTVLVKEDIEIARKG